METYPPNVVTPYGVKLLREGCEPLVTYTSGDGDIVFYLNGGLAPWPGVTEGVVLSEGISGLYPIFNHLDHKGARQDGVTWSDTVYDPAEITMKVTLTANTPAGLKTLMRKWFAAWDPENPGTLSWVTPDSGQWFCKVRLMRPPMEKLDRTYARSCQQTFTWVIRNDDAFWRSTDSLSEFALTFDSASDDFNRDGEGTLGVNWAQTYTGQGAGVCEAESTSSGSSPGRARWSANDPDTYFTGKQNVVIGPFRDYSTDSNTQKIDIIINNTPEFTTGTGAANKIWGRMGHNPDGTWDGNGICGTVGWGFVQISAWVDFEETVLHRIFQLIPPIAGERYSLWCGDADGDYVFTMKRSGVQIIYTTDENQISNMGAAYRGIGFGFQAGAAILTQATPGEVRSIRSDGNLVDGFTYTTDSGLGPNWPLLYGGSGDSYVRAANGRAVWVDVALGRRVVNRWLGSNEVQTVEVSGSPSAITLTFNGTEADGTSEPTSSIAYPATPGQIATALEALPSINSGDVAVTGDTGGPYEITFQGQYARVPMQTMSAAISSGGVNPFITVASTTKGQSQTTLTDNQIVSLKIGNLFQFPFPSAAFIDLWARMDDNDAAPTGVRLRIGPQWIQLSSFNAGVHTQMKYKTLLTPPWEGELWTLTCGSSGNARKFTVTRAGSTETTYTDKDGISPLGADYRGVGFGMESGDGTFQQNVPPAVVEWSMGDNGALTQSGLLPLTNFGDQPGYPDIIVFGPGTFGFSNGPGSDIAVTFGPLTDNQIALLKTAPGQRGVYDITVDSDSGDGLAEYANFIKELESLAYNNNIAALMDWFQSEFGITPSQGVMYSLLDGRFSKPWPARTVAGATTSSMSVQITDGNANSKVIAALTPRRRWPE